MFRWIKKILTPDQLQPAVFSPQPTAPPPASHAPATIPDEWKSLIDRIDQSDNNHFITGQAGTGKSTLLKWFLATTRKNAAVVAPTGVAALNVGGQTIHSFAHLPPRVLVPGTYNVWHNGRGVARNLDVLFIDEVSMVRCDVLDALDNYLRRNGPDGFRPFGGIKIVLFGDPFQLPPVAEAEEREVLLQSYPTSFYFWRAHAYMETAWQVHPLTTVYRQDDPEFLAMLGRIRVGTVTRDDLFYLNSRVIPGFDPHAEPFHLTLTPTNPAANQRNNARLRQLPGPDRQFHIELTGEAIKVKDLPCDRILRLKVGARVICVKNLTDSVKNGTLGIVMELDDHSAWVRLDSGTSYRFERTVWEKITYRFDQANGRVVPEVVGTIKQIPLRLAWALTIHKAQGLTLDRVCIDIGNGAFDHGQAYVALSRCKTLEGIKLAISITNNDIIVDQEVQRFGHS